MCRMLELRQPLDTLWAQPLVAEIKVLQCFPFKVQFDVPRNSESFNNKHLVIFPFRCILFGFQFKFNMNRVTLLLLFSLLLYTRYAENIKRVELKSGLTTKFFSFFALVVELKTSEASLLEIVTGRNAAIINHYHHHHHHHHHLCRRRHHHHHHHHHIIISLFEIVTGTGWFFWLVPPKIF